MTGQPRFTDVLGQRLLVCDGAMGTMLHAAGCALDRALPEVNLSDPKLVAAIHESYVSAGADVIQTNTFGANRLWMAGHGYPDQVEEIEAGRYVASKIRGARFVELEGDDGIPWLGDVEAVRHRHGLDAAERLADQGQHRQHRIVTDLRPRRRCVR